MQNSRNDRRGSDRIASTRSQVTRRHRTLAALGCESLELRKLMTGFAGASGMMMPHSVAAEMGDMNGGGGGNSEWHGARGWHANDDRTATTNTADATGGQSDGQDTTATSHMTRGLAGGGNRDDFAAGRHEGFGGMGEDRRMGGEMDGGDDQAMGDQGPGDAPMSSQTQASTGNTQLDTDMEKLRTDEQAIHDKSEVTPKLLASVRKDLEAIDQAKTGTADATALKTLQTDEQTIFASQTAPTDAQKTQLQADRDAVLKSQGVSQTLIDQLAADRLAVKTASNFTSDDQATLDADHAAIEKDRAAAQPTATDTTDSATPPTTPDSSATAAAATPATPDATPATPDATPATPAATPATPDATAPAAATTTATPAVTTAATTTPAATDATATTTTATGQTALPTMTMHRGMRGGMGHSFREMAAGMGGAGHQGQQHGGMGHGHHGHRSVEN